MLSFKEQLTSGTIVKFANNDLGVYVENGYKDKNIYVLNFEKENGGLRTLDMSLYKENLQHINDPELDIIEVTKGLTDLVFLMNEVMDYAHINNMHKVVIAELHCENNELSKEEKW